MITVNLNDPNLKENLQAIKELRELGYPEEQLQKLYDKQVEADKRSEQDET